MKKLIFAGLMLLSSQAFGDFNIKDFLRNQFCHDHKLSRSEEAIEAIREGNVKQVFKLVKSHNTTQTELENYIKVADEHLGLAPIAKIEAKLIGMLCIGLGFACLYKAFDHYNKEYGIWKNKANPKEILEKIYKRFFIDGDDKKGDDHGGPLHCILVDIATIASLISAQKGISGALDSIKPKCDVNNHLMIQLYLRNLVKPKTAESVQAA